jgi:hypothetical protein
MNIAILEIQMNRIINKGLALAMCMDIFADHEKNDPFESHEAAYRALVDIVRVYIEKQEPYLDPDHPDHSTFEATFQ